MLMVCYICVYKCKMVQAYPMAECWTDTYVYDDNDNVKVLYIGPGPNT